MTGRDSSEYWDAEYKKNQPEFWQIPDRCLRQILTIAPRNGKILDVGCGVGNLVERIASQRFLVSGIDHSKEAITLGLKRNPHLRLSVADVATVCIPQQEIAFLSLVMPFLRKPEVVLRKLNKMSRMIITMNVVSSSHTAVNGFETDELDAILQRSCNCVQEIFSEERNLDTRIVGHLLTRLTQNF